MTCCTICAAATHGHDDDDEAWCTFCFEHFILSQQLAPRRAVVQAERTPVWTREALLAMRAEHEGEEHA